jgi:glutathione S-transferase
MTYRLYNRIGSGGFVVEAALALAGAPFELVELDSKAGTPLPDSFRETNPWGQVPTLVLPDGSIMTETAAILIHLAACFPDKALAPAPGTSAHAAFLRWIVFANVNVYEAVLRSAYPHRFTSDPNATEATRTAAVTRMGEALGVLEEAIGPGPFLLGDAISVADVYIAMLCVWFRGDIDASRLVVLTDGVRQNPIVGPIWRRHFGDR